MTDFVREVALDSVDEAGEQLNLTEEAKDELVTEIESYIDHLEKKELPKESIEEIAERYRESDLATATRVLVLSQHVMASGLNPAEKQKAAQTVQKFAYVAGSGRLPRESVDRIVDSLTAGKRLSMSELKQIRIPDARLASWLASVRSSIDSIDIDDVSLKEEVAKLFRQLTPAVSAAAERPVPGREINMRALEKEIERLPLEMQELARQRLRERGK